MVMRTHESYEEQADGALDLAFTNDALKFDGRTNVMARLGEAITCGLLAIAAAIRETKS